MLDKTYPTRLPSGSISIKGRLAKNGAYAGTGVKIKRKRNRTTVTYGGVVALEEIRNRGLTPEVEALLRPDIEIIYKPTVAEYMADLRDRQNPR